LTFERGIPYILSSNMIKNCPVTDDDLMLAVNVYGPDVASLKGKLT